MSRLLYLVAYDVRHPKRLRHTLIMLKEFASGGQKSAFECYLSRAEKQEMLNRAEQLLNLEEDAFLIIQLKNRDAVDVLGKAIKPMDSLYTYLG